MNRRQRRALLAATNGPHPDTGKRVDQLDAAELHRQLVTDAIGGLETPPGWFLAACDRIARLDRTDPETVYQRVREEVASLGRSMPGAPLR